MGIDILGCIASTTTLRTLRASIFGKFRRDARAESRFWWDCKSDTVNGLTIPVTARSFSVSPCSVAHSVTEDHAMDDSAESPAACDDTVPPVRRRTSISAVSEPSLISIGLSLGNS